MARKSSAPNILEQSRAAAAAAKDATGPQKEALLAASKTLNYVDQKRRRRQETSQPLVTDISEYATTATLKAARLHQSVQRGTEIYLPWWKENSIGLPNALLRSSLWSAGKLSEETLQEADIPTLGEKVRLIYTGEKLNCYSRRVLAACLDCYRDRPLASDRTKGNGVEISFFKFCKLINTSYSLDVHLALRRELQACASMSLRLTLDTTHIPALGFFSVEFPDNYSDINNTGLKGSDVFTFWVHEAIAPLYGLNSWTALPKQVLPLKGLKGWLACFLCTHSKTYGLPIATFRKLSGMESRKNDFNDRIFKALEYFRNEIHPENYRVAWFKEDDESKKLEICCVTWPGAHRENANG